MCGVSSRRASEEATDMDVDRETSRETKIRDLGKLRGAGRRIYEDVGYPLEGAALPRAASAGALLGISQRGAP